MLQAWCAGIPRQARPEGINLVETTGGVETHVRREVIGFSERSPREKRHIFGVPRCTIKYLFVVTSSVRGEICVRWVKTQDTCTQTVVRLHVDFFFLSIRPLRHTRAVTAVSQRSEGTRLSVKDQLVQGCQSKVRGFQTASQRSAGSRLPVKGQRVPGCQSKVKESRLPAKGQRVPDCQPKVRGFQAASQRSEVPGCQSKVRGFQTASQAYRVQTASQRSEGFRLLVKGQMAQGRLQISDGTRLPVKGQKVPVCQWKVRGCYDASQKIPGYC